MRIWPLRSIAENAEQLAAAVGANRETAEGVIKNALAIAEVTFRQSDQNTYVTWLYASTTANAADITEVREAIATEEGARAIKAAESVDQSIDTENQ